MRQYPAGHNLLTPNGVRGGRAGRLGRANALAGEVKGEQDLRVGSRLSREQAGRWIRPARVRDSS